MLLDVIDGVMGRVIDVVKDIHILMSFVDVDDQTIDVIDDMCTW